MLGVYISVPFCRTKCTYCNFASDVFSKAAYESYALRVLEDISRANAVAAELECDLPKSVDSIYLGGGTPSILESSQLVRIFDAVRSGFALCSDAEITVECAPASLSPQLVETLVRCGVNRVSLGVQSFVDREAASVGRLHKHTTVMEEIARLREFGITNINIDLIAGLPHQTAESWKYSLSEAIATEAPHVSVYMLEVDEDSRLGRELIAGGTRYHAHFVPDEDAVADFYLQACDSLNAAGVHQYEISNFARVGYESKHNLKYWTRQPYIGFGVDAHSMLAARPGFNYSDSRQSVSPNKLRDYKIAISERHGNQTFPRPSPAGASEISPALQRWVDGKLESKSRRDDRNESASPVGPNLALRFSTPDSLDAYLNRGSLQLTPITNTAALEENFFLGLRLNRGVDLDALRATLGREQVAVYESEIDDLLAEGLLEQHGSIIRLTPRGRLLSNEVFARFLRDRELAPEV